MTYKECRKCKNYSNEYGVNFCWYFACPIKEEFPCDEYFRNEIKNYDGNDLQEEQHLYTELSNDKILYKVFESQFKEWARDLEYRIHIEDNDI